LIKLHVMKSYCHFAAVLFELSYDRNVNCEIYKKYATFAFAWILLSVPVLVLFISP
jgi:hypothetical protein